MESEARLVMLDGGLPEPLLQYEIVDHDGRLWRVDFLWPEQKVIVEYDGFDWHGSPEHLRRDRQKRAALQELGWRLISSSLMTSGGRPRRWCVASALLCNSARPKAVSHM